MEIVLVLLEMYMTLSNVYEKIKILETIESRKFKGNVDAPFGLKKLFSYINNSAKFLAQTKLWATFYIGLAK